MKLVSRWPRALTLLVLALAGCSSDSKNDTASAGGSSGTGGSSTGGGGTGGFPPDYTFERFTGSSAEPDVTSDRLCPDAAAPDEAADKVFIDCELEGAAFAPASPAAKDELLVMAYNFERGLDLDRQVDALLNEPALPLPDVILASELDRGCSRTGSRNTPREIAQQLGMDYVFAVEFLELPRDAGGGGAIEATCEHGNAIFSRYPLGNVGQLRHTLNKSWYMTPEERESMDGEPRLGGRILVYGDVLVGNKVLHVSALHYESSPADNEFTVAQAVETAELGLTWPFQVVHGGDTNAPYYFLDLMSGTKGDLVTQAFFERGYIDAHSPLERADRGTRGGLVIDLLFGNGEFFDNPQVCPKETCEELSDHLPVWATVQLQ